MFHGRLISLMATFPRTEADLVALSEAIQTGLLSNVAIYPAPPVIPADLAMLRSAYTSAKNAAIAAQAAAEQAIRRQLFISKSLTAQSV